MVEIVNNNGVTCAESRLTVDQETAKVLKKQANQKCIKALCKDFHVAHKLEECNGDIVSVVGRQLEGRLNLEELRTISVHHRTLLDKVTAYNKSRNAEEETDKPHKSDEDIIAEYLAHKCRDLSANIENYSIVVAMIPNKLLV